LPVKNAILNLESRKTTLADCMVHLFHIAAIVKNTSTADYKAFHQACIIIFNKRYLKIFIKIIIIFILFIKIIDTGDERMGNNCMFLIY